MVRYQIHAPLPVPTEVFISGQEISDGEPVKATLVGVSCYPGEQVTFWVRGEGGWYYSYLPQHYVSTSSTTSYQRTWIETEKHRFVTPKGHSGFAVDAPIVPTVLVDQAEHKTLAMIDFLECNELVWVIAHPQGAIRVLTHRRFDSALPPGGLRKMRETWR